MKQARQPKIDLDMVKNQSAHAMQEAFAVLEGIKDGSIALATAMEMSNAIGKANGAIANIIKADLLCLAMDKVATHTEAKRILKNQ